MNIFPILQTHRREFAEVLPHEIQHGVAYVMDLSSPQSVFAHIDPHDIKALIAATEALKQQQVADILIGRYAEDRFIYQGSDLFGQDAIERSVHLGVDLSVPAGTPVFAPWKGSVHSFKNNTASGDYGPTIVLQHELENMMFYTLYGHLAMQSLTSIQPQQVIETGECFAEIGDFLDNGGWPPHLHFQIIDDMQGYYGDFPGVVKKSESSIYFKRCPDPNVMLNIAVL